MIYSSYFGKVNELLRRGFKKEDFIGICVYKCNWLKDIKYCEELMVKKSWLWNYKNGLIEWEEYRKKYLEYLYGGVSLKFWWDFKKNFDGKILLCYEKNYNFCHRKLVGDFYFYMFGEKIIKEI